MQINLNDIPVCVINLKESVDRLKRTQEELNSFYSTNKHFILIDAVKSKIPMNGIAQSHLKCIELAKKNNWNAVVIVEDDVKFTSKHSKLYADTIFSNVPHDADILLSGVYTGTPTKYNGDWNKIEEFSGLHYYVVLKHAYDKFFEFKQLTPQHIDRALGRSKPNGLGMNCYVSDFFFAIQYDGYSYNVERDVSYSHLLAKYKILN